MRKMLVMVLVLGALIALPARAFAQDDPRAPLRELPNDADGPLASIAAEGPVSAAIRREGARLAQDRPRSRRSGPESVLTGTSIGAGAGAALSQTDAVAGGNHDPRSWPRRHPVWTGFLIGAGTGALLAGAATKDQGCIEYGNPPCPFMYAALGAGFVGGIGALIGLAF